MRIHHYGLLTSDISSSKKALEGLGFVEVAEAQDHLQGAHLVMLEATDLGQKIELVKPFATNTALGKLLKHKSDHMYHVCFETASIEGAESHLSRITNGNYVKLSEEKPAILFGGRLVSFFLCQGLGLIEILATPPKN